MMRPSSTHPHILVAPLDWGLGHTARCVPIVRHLLARGCRVTMAGVDWQQSFYRQTFPEVLEGGELRLRALAGYDVRYAATGAGFLPRLLQQGPRILRTIATEHRWLRSAVEEEGFDGVISDNRYGLHHPHVPTVILTHQVSLLTGLGTAVDGLLRRLHYRALEKFGACWLVDVPEAPGLSGALAHPGVLPRNARHIGLLSQFSREGSEEKKRSDANGLLLILLSGPEPQRTMLSQRLWAQVQGYGGPVVFVEGREDAPAPPMIPPHITHHRRLTSGALRPLLEAASLVVCRSGYSTLMDLVAMGKRAIVIPTPGQTEQEYLARTLHERGVFYAARKGDFSLEDVLREAAGFPFRQGEWLGSFEAFVPVLGHWLNVL